MRDALRHPFGLALLIISVLLAAAVRFLPAPEPWSAQPSWIFLSGLLAYAASVAVVYRRRVAPVETEEPGPGSPDGVPVTDPETGPYPPDNIAPLVQDALRKLTSTAALSKGELVHRLPATIAAARSQWGSGGMAEPTPLEQAQALREALVSAIEQLKPAGENVKPGAPEALQYFIVNELYVHKKPTSYILTKCNIAESTLHRNRRAAVSALARHLEAQEAQLQRDERKTSKQPLAL